MPGLPKLLRRLSIEVDKQCHMICVANRQLIFARGVTKNPLSCV